MWFLVLLIPVMWIVGATVLEVYTVTSREVFWDFRMKDLVWEWFELFLWTSHLPKYQIQPWSHVKWPGWWLGTAIPIFPWGVDPN